MNYLYVIIIPLILSAWILPIAFDRRKHVIALFDQVWSLSSNLEHLRVSLKNFGGKADEPINICNIKDKEETEKSLYDIARQLLSKGHTKAADDVIHILQQMKYAETNHKKMSYDEIDDLDKQIQTDARMLSPNWFAILIANPHNMKAFYKRNRLVIRFILALSASLGIILYDAMA